VGECNLNSPTSLALTTPSKHPCHYFNSSFFLCVGTAFPTMTAEVTPATISLYHCHYLTRPPWLSNHPCRGDGGWAKKEKKHKVFLVPNPKKIPGPGWMAQTPRAGMGDSMSRFRRYWWSTLINYDSHLLVCGTVLKKLIPPTKNRELQKRPTIWIWVQLLWTFGHFAPQHQFCTKELYNPGLPPSSPPATISLPLCGYHYSRGYTPP